MRSSKRENHSTQGAKRTGSRIERRDLLKWGGLAALSAPFIVPARVLGKEGATAANEKMTLGIIGLGERGNGNMRRFLEIDDVRVAAVCDVAETHRAKAKAFVDEHYGNPDCAASNDFQELIARPDLDALVVTVPDHWHVLIGIAAARAGKHLYYEKPVGVSLEQAQALRQAVKRHKVVFQFGTQQRSSEQFRIACELARNQIIGELKTIYVGSPASFPFPAQPEQPVPAGFDYDRWLGPAPLAPYTYHRYRSYNQKEGYGIWYHIHDYCLGFIVNWGIHHLDIAQWGNGSELTGPISVEGNKGEFPKEGLANNCMKWELEFQYANGVKMIYSDENGRCKHGVRFEGPKGWVHVTREKLYSDPESLVKTPIGPNGIHLPRSDDHHRNFVDAVRKGTEVICPIDVAVKTDTVAQLANIASRLGRKLQWDPEQEKFTGDDEANRMLSRPMRDPWTLKAFVE